jgi:hypothetical protein
VLFWAEAKIPVAYDAFSIPTGEPVAPRGVMA